MPTSVSRPTSGLPARRPELLIRPLGEQGQHVVKDPRSGGYFHLGPEEHFLLTQLDGRRTAADVTAAFADRFGESLSEQELELFLELARGQGLLADEPDEAADEPPEYRPAQETAPRTSRTSSESSQHDSPRRWQSILYWRKSFWDPDRLFTWLAPRLWFFWTRGFVVISAVSIALAALVLLEGHREAASSFTQALRWETAVWVWLTVLAVTLLHESAHGLTCKHFGGEVHEIGFLLLFFMPCFYCNVSDAWLFREKRKRLLVTFAGGYFELFLWSLAVFTWRVTEPDTLVHYLAFVVLVSCGVQSVFHFNPLIKLDGYYLLSDWWEIPNLRERAQSYFKAWIRCLLWGAPRPAAEPRGRTLVGFGLTSWLYTVLFLTLILWSLFRLLWPTWGWVGFGGVAVLGLVGTRAMFHGIADGEIRNMLATRYRRSMLWLLGLGGLAASLCLVQIEDRACAPFRFRAVTRAEVRSRVSGFLKEIYAGEGDQISPGTVLATFDVPDLKTRLAQKQAEVAEARARLRLLEIGPNPVEVAEQRGRVERMKSWRDLAEKDLGQARRALDEELARLVQQIAQQQAEADAAEAAFRRAENLRGKNATTEEEYQEAMRKHKVAQTLLAQAQLQKRHREALGTREAIAGLDAEAELARREKDLADAQATLNLLESGTRPEEIDAERARLARLEEEVRYLEGLKKELVVACPVSGVVVTPHLEEKVGQYFHEGDLICLVERPVSLEAEIDLHEQDVARVRPGQVVKIKVRALPFETFEGRVNRIAPAAEAEKLQTTVTVSCRLEGGPADLRPEMTGYARIYTGPRAIGAIIVDRVLRFVRTEFWW